MSEQEHTAQNRRVMVALLLPLFASLMSISSVMVALPAIEEGLGATSSDLQWVLSGYALAFGVGLVPSGRAGDLWGRRRMFLIGVAVFGLTSLVAAFSPNPGMLNLMRILMGLAASMLVPQIIGMIQRLFTGSARGRAYGLMSTVIGLAVALGPLIAGSLIDLAPSESGWRLVFLINVPVVVIALFFAFLWLPKPQDDDIYTVVGGHSGVEDTYSSADPHLSGSSPAPPRGVMRLDPIGALLLSGAIVLMMVPVIQFQNVMGLILGISGAVMLAGWLAWEKRLGSRHADAPMVNLKLFALPSFTWNSAVLILYFAGMPAIWAIVALYVQQGLGHGAFVAGLVTLPSAVMVTLLAAEVGKRVERMGPRMLMVGTIVAFVSMLALAAAAALMATDYGSLWWIAAALGVNGFSQALIIPSAQTLSMQDVPEPMAGAAGGVAQTAQRVVTAMGLAVVTAVYFLVTDRADHQSGMLVSSLMLAGIMVFSMVVAFGAARQAHRSR